MQGYRAGDDRKVPGILEPGKSLIIFPFQYNSGRKMIVLSIDTLFDAAVQIQLLERSISLTFSKNSVRIKFPTTRRLAEFLEVPHYYVLPYFAAMEQEGLVTRAERVGILTTEKGSRMMIGLMAARYQEETKQILGPVIFKDLVKNCSSR